jgi:hypothetical protein
MAGALLDRYNRGEHEAVWRELRLAPALDASAYDEALTVARATMRRVAHNAGVIAGRLEKVGWHALSGGLVTAPAPGDSEVAASIEGFTGARLPPSLKAFWEIVGGIDFVWDYERGEPPTLLGVDVFVEAYDPLCVCAAHQCAYLIDEWRDRAEYGDHDNSEPWPIDLAPDALHKANTSGGPPYGILVPFAGADPIFAEEPHELPFVDYLRLCFRFGGFPGLKWSAERDHVRALLAHLTEGLLAF